MKRRRGIRERLTTQRALIGLMQTRASSTLAEMAGLCGYDFVFLDTEHGIFGASDVLHTLQVLTSVDVLALVRLAGHDLQAVGRYLDMGADAIVVPNVATAEQARALARAMEYPPAGTRGIGAAAHRATRYGMDLAAHFKSPRDGACLIAIIESALGVSNVEDILAVEGIDGAILGPADLSADLGHAVDFTRPAYVDAVTRIERAAAATGKWLGAPPHPCAPLEALIARGHRLLIVGADMPLIREAMCAQVAKARTCIASNRPPDTSDGN